jgi:hypothetical protein
MIVERVCRVAAILIAVLAVVDPVWVVARSAPPRVLVSLTDGATEVDRDRVIRALSDDFDVTAEPSPDIAIHVVVGRRVPVTASDDLSFVVAPAPSADAPEIREVRVADEVSLDAVSPVTVRLTVPEGHASQDVIVSLFADNVLVDTRILVAETAATSVDLLFVPARQGLARLRISARLDDGPEAFADVATEVTRRPLRVLSYEGQASWAATFLRRALENDPRFEVVVRAVTSRGVTAEAGAPPASLERADELTSFDVVVVSTPEALGGAAAAALESYLRNREGAVVLLPGAGDAAVLSRLTGVQTWIGERRPALASVDSALGDWTASEFLWPGAWPASAGGVAGCLSPGRCAVWRVPVGGGRVVVSSALDGWRTRAAEGSAFAAFWRSVVGDEAEATPGPVEVTLSSRLVEPGSFVAAEIQVRDQGGALHAEWQATDGAVQPVRLWPAGAGRHHAEFRAPDVPGRYRLHVESSRNAGEPLRAISEFLVVEPGAVHRTLTADHASLSAFASTHGGGVVPMAALDSLGGRLSAAVSTSLHDTPTRPMRSPWWIALFAGALAVEWWSRRRRGAR